MSEQDDIGRAGERLAAYRLEVPCWRRGERLESFFRVTDLGEKSPTVDLLARLLSVRVPTFFLAQVKATRNVPVHPDSRLLVEFPAADVRRLLASQMPTYLIAVDVVNEVPYILATRPTMRNGLTSFPRAHPLTPGNLRLLWREVRRYWKGVQRPRRRSVFTE